MTDPRTPEGRVDLRPLDIGHDQTRADAVIAAVVARIGNDGRPHAPPGMTELLLVRRVLLAAAAVLVAVATAAVFAGPSPVTAASPPDVIASWTESSHVPTNGELLAAYHGYRP